MKEITYAEYYQQTLIPAALGPQEMEDKELPKLLDCSRPFIFISKKQLV
jgi:hypothetical protein